MLSVKPRPILRYPYKNFPHTWVICLLIAVVALLFAFGLLSGGFEIHAAILGVALLLVAGNYTVQTYAWFRYRHTAKELYKKDTEAEAASNRELIQSAKTIFDRKPK